MVANRPKTPVSDDAADTVIEPERVAVVVEVVAGELEELPQAAATSATMAMATAARMRMRGDRRLALMPVPPPP